MQDWSNFCMCHLRLCGHCSGLIYLKFCRQFSYNILNIENTMLALHAQANLFKVKNVYNIPKVQAHYKYSVNTVFFNRTMFICCCCNLTFYDRSECVMSVPGTTKHSSCNCIDTWQYSCIVLYLFQARNTDTGQATMAKKFRLDEGAVRKSQRHRKQRGEKEMKVSSDLTLRAFKIKVQNVPSICSRSRFYFILWLQINFSYHYRCIFK